MLGVLPKSQGIANKKDDLAKRGVIFSVIKDYLSIEHAKHP